jgi:hypothetical protein
LRHGFGEAAMTTFDEREKGYEAQLAHDEDLRFRAYVRRNRNLGLWAAERLGRSDEAAEAYAATLIKIHLEGDGDESVFAKLRADFAAAGLPDSDHQIRREMAETLAKVTREISSRGTPAH